METPQAAAHCFRPQERYALSAWEQLGVGWQLWTQVGSQPQLLAQLR